MNQDKFDVNALRIASPCPMSWESMKGDDRSRSCSLCKLDVHNISGLTLSEVERLFAQQDGRVCVRLYRRADGTVLTKDCPVGVRGYRKRLGALAAATFATILSLLTISYGQKERSTKIDASKGTVVKSVESFEKTSLRGVVVDPNGAVVPGVKIFLYREEKKPDTEAQSDSEGQFVFPELPAGIYEIRVPRAGGFRGHIIQNLEIRAGMKTEITVELNIDEDTVLVGVVASEPLIDLTTNEQKTVITREMLDRLPGRRPFD